MAQILYNKAYAIDAYPDEAAGILDHFLKNGAIDCLSLIVPTGRLVRKLRFDSIRRYFDYHKKPAGTFGIYTFSQFVERCAGSLVDLGQYHIVSEAYRLAMFGEAISNADLQFYKQGGQRVSTALIQRLANVIYGLRKDGIRTKELRKELEDSDITHDTIFDPTRLQDIANIYEEYEKLLGDKYLDEPGMIYLVNSILSKSDGNDRLNEIFGSDNVIFLDEFTEFRLPEREFLSAFVDAQAGLALNIDYRHDNGPLYGNLRETMAALEKSGFAKRSTDKFVIESEEKEEFDKSKRTEYLRKWLFNAEKDIRNPNFSEMIRIVKTEDRIEEVRFLAKLIRYLCANGYRPSDICVTMRKPENYSDLFREIFFLHNIPVNISDRFPLEKSPVTVGVFALLDCIAKGFRGSDVQRALESKYLKFYRDENADEEINTINLIQVAQDLRIIGGYARGAHKGWIARLESTIDRIEKEIELMEKYQETEEIDMMVARTQLEKVRLALYDFNIFINSLPLSAGKLRPREFSDFIKNDIIMRHHVAGNIRDYYEQSINRSEIGTNTEFIYYQEDAEKNAHALAALNEAIDEMTFILEDRATADADSGMGNPVSGYSPAFYADRLRTAVSGAKYQIREKQRYGVTVTAIEQTRSIPYKVMILCGALDGEFPLAFRSERFLGKELYGSELRHIQSERLQFYQFLANAPEIINSGSKKIYITFPARENERELVRSSFVDELLKITTLQADGCLADLSGGQIPGGYEFVNTITSRQELLQKYCEFQNIDPENRELRDIAEKTGLGDKIRFIDQARIRKQDAVPEGVILVSKLPEQIAADYSKSTNLAISVSDLDSYAKCPYAYFVEKKLRIKKYEEPELALSPLETGNTLHKIVFRFYSELRESEGGRRINPTELYLPDFIFTRLDPDREDEYRERLMEIAREEIERLKFDHPFFGLEEQRIMGTPTTPGYLRSWLSAELRRIRMGWPYTPGLFEFSFGMPSRNHAQSLPPVEFDGFRLRGKIDRIEIDPDTDTPQLLIGDYKTSLGSASSTGNILEGKSFQMPLYLAAAKQFMSDKYHTSIEFGGAAYYPFDPYYDKKNSKFKYEQAVLADDRSKLSMNTGLKKNINISGSRNLVSAEDAVESSIKMAKEIVEDIRAGQFPVDPSGNSCTYCAFGPLCRKKEMGEIEDF